MSKTDLFQYQNLAKMEAAASVGMLREDEFRLGFDELPDFADQEGQVMLSNTSYDLDLSSECFRFLAARLNAMDCKNEAAWSVDIFSSSFKFDDETPDETIVFNGFDISLKLATLMRRLWGYRMSLIMGNPRLDLAETWESGKSLAPNWAGFRTDRCSSAMQPIVQEVREKILQFDQDIGRLEAQFEERMNRKRESRLP